MNISFKLFAFLSIFLLLITACEKNELLHNVGTIQAETYTYNQATTSFDLGDQVTAAIAAPQGIRFVYCYLVRGNATDSLIHVTNATLDNPTQYQLQIPGSAFPKHSMQQVRGIKVLVKQADNSSIEGFVSLNYYDPEKPYFQDFPISIQADLDGGKTPITGLVQSAVGLQKIELYDDYQKEGEYHLLQTFTDLQSSKAYRLEMDYSYRKAAQHIRVVATDIFGQQQELIIAMPVDLSAFKPIFEAFPQKVTPIIGQAVMIAGQIKSIAGLKEIEIYDDYNGAFTLIHKIDNLQAATMYDMNYSYNFRKRAQQLKIIAIDLEGLRTELLIALDFEYQTILYRDITMSAQTLGTQSGFLSDNGRTISNCDLPAHESDLSFLFYATANGPTFYSPTNTGSISANLKCGNSPWVIGNAGALRATRFRVLVNESSIGVTEIYNLYKQQELEDLSNEFFVARSILAPGSSGPRYEANGAPSATLFNLTSANLIYTRIPTGATTFKNALIQVKDIHVDGGNSTIRFDILIQK